METIVFFVRNFGPPLGIAICWLWETWRPARPWAGFAPGSRSRHDIINLAIGLANAALVAAAFSALLASVAAWTASERWGLLNQRELPLYVRWPIVLLLLDGLIYLWHRVNHGAPWLWRLHRTHHSDRHLTVTTAARFHVGEIALSAAAKTALIPLFGFHLTEFAVYETLLAVSVAFHHANVSLGKWDAVLRVAFVTPDMHKVHHSIDPRETHSNFSTILSVWDRLGNTFRHPNHTESIEFGVAELADGTADSFTGIWTTPFRRSPTDSAPPPLREEP